MRVLSESLSTQCLEVIHDRCKNAFKHVFIAGNISGGLIHQYRVKTRPNDYDSHAKQTFLFGERDIVVGALFYLKSKDKCNSCPNW